MLLRNRVLTVGVEMWVKIYSPNVRSLEIVKRAEKRARRARLYYMRYVFPLFLHLGFGLTGSLKARAVLICGGQETETR